MSEIKQYKCDVCCDEIPSPFAGVTSLKLFGFNREMSLAESMGEGDAHICHRCWEGLEDIMASRRPCE